MKLTIECTAPIKMADQHGQCAAASQPCLNVRRQHPALREPRHEHCSGQFRNTMEHRLGRKKSTVRLELCRRTASVRACIPTCNRANHTKTCKKAGEGVVEFRLIAEQPSAYKDRGAPCRKWRMKRLRWQTQFTPKNAQTLLWITLSKQEKQRAL